MLVTIAEVRGQRRHINVNYYQINQKYLFIISNKNVLHKNIIVKKPEEIFG